MATTAQDATKSQAAFVTPTAARIQNTAKLLEVSSFAYAAIELLVEKGLIDIEVLDRKKKEVANRLVEKFRQERIGAAYQDPEQASRMRSIHSLICTTPRFVTGLRFDG
jgi:hypothetical protein